MPLLSEWEQSDFFLKPKVTVLSKIYLTFNVPAIFVLQKNLKLKKQG